MPIITIPKLLPVIDMIAKVWVMNGFDSIAFGASYMYLMKSINKYEKLEEEKKK